MQFRQKMAAGRLVLVLLYLWVGLGSLAAGPVPAPKVVQAIPVESAIQMDGVLGELVWKTRPYTGFIQSEPRDGAKPSEKTEVWVAFDEDALYIAARMHDSRPADIAKVVGRRDDWVASDWFIVGIDSYFDHRSGLEFAVNPAGSVVDWTLYNDEWRDSTWDGIWTTAARIDETGWTVEIRIPYSQLRFKPGEIHTWGVNFRRVINRRNETCCFAYVPKNESGYVSRFAHLVGLRGITSGKRFAITPYSVGSANFSQTDEGNPFQDGHSLGGSAGMDMRMRIKNDMMLNVTVNPDFGQVEVDPAVLNLGANEIYLQERRPFFVEGCNLFRFGYGGATNHWGFNWGSPSFFYSRRIGGEPRGTFDSADYVSAPDGTTILGAAKMTGKVMGNWNLGVVSALTQREYARVSAGEEVSSQEVEPFAWYGVARIQRELNEGRQGVGFILSSVARNPLSEAMKSQFNRNSVGFGMDGWTFLDRNKVWVISGWLGSTVFNGNAVAMAERQQSYLHYFQRPDARYMNFDPESTNMRGWAGRLLLNKQKGNWFVNASLGAISPGFDTTEMGFQWRADLINSHFVLGYRNFTEGSVFRNWAAFVATWRSYNFGGDRIGSGYFFTASGQLKNYWSLNTSIFVTPECMDDRRTRGGPLTREAPGFSASIGLRTNTGKRFVFGVDSSISEDSLGAKSWSFGNSLSWKLRPNLMVSVGTGFRRWRNPVQWVGAFEDPLMSATYGNRYVFAGLDQRTISAEFRVNWSFTPKMSLQLYLQPYISVGGYSVFKQLERPGTMDYSNLMDSGSVTLNGEGVYAVDPDGVGPAAGFSFDNPDFNFKSLRGTMVFRWEYRPGSAVFLVWTQRRRDDANPGDLSMGRDLSDMFMAKGDNIFMVKFSHRFEI